MLPTLLYEAFSSLKDTTATTTIPGAFLADPEIIEKLFVAVRIFSL